MVAFNSSVKFRRAPALPARPSPNSVYFLGNGDSSQIVVTSQTGDAELTIDPNVVTGATSLLTLGADNTGLVDIKPALTAALTAGGVYYGPAGDYLFDGSGIDFSNWKKSVQFIWHPAARIFTNGMEGDFIRLHVPTDGVGLPSDGVDLIWEGGLVDFRNLKNSTSIPSADAYPPANLGTRATGDCISIYGVYTNGGTNYNGVNRVVVRNANFVAGDHWQTAGGDQALSLGNGCRYTLVENCYFKGCRDLAVYATSDGSGTTGGRVDIIGNTAENCYFGFSVKRQIRSFSMTRNRCINCVTGINVNQVIGGRDEAGVIHANDFVNCNRHIRVDYSKRVTVSANTGRDLGALDASGVPVSTYGSPYAYVFQGCTDSVINGNSAEGVNQVFADASILAYLLQVTKITLSATDYLSTDNVFEHNFQRGLRGTGGEVTGGADYNRFRYNYGLDTTVDPIILAGAHSTETRWDRVNACEAHMTPLGYGDGSAALPVIRRRTQANTGVFFAANKVGVAAGGVERIAANNVGVAFNAATPMVKPTISGSRGGNAALAALLTQLAAYGLITDGTTA